MNPWLDKLSSIDWKSPQSLITLISTILVLVSYTLGLSHGSEPKAMICKEELKLLSVQSDQIRELQKTAHSNLQSAQISCVKREQDVCSARMDTFRESLTKLRCKICKAQGDQP